MAWAWAFDDDKSDGFLLGEVAFHVYNADREEACFVDQSAVRAFVDVNRAVRGEAMEEPEGTVANRVRIRQKAGVGWWFWQAVQIQGRDGAREMNFL